VVVVVGIGTVVVVGGKVVVVVGAGAETVSVYRAMSVGNPRNPERSVMVTRCWTGRVCGVVRMVIVEVHAPPPPHAGEKPTVMVASTVVASRQLSAESINRVATTEPPAAVVPLPGLRVWMAAPPRVAPATSVAVATETMAKLRAIRIPICQISGFAG
jgi:hypothetical protein